MIAPVDGDYRFLFLQGTNNLPCHIGCLKLHGEIAILDELGSNKARTNVGKMNVQPSDVCLLSEAFHIEALETLGRRVGRCST